MGAKFKSKKHLIYRFFALFLCVWLQSSKSTNMTNFFLLKKVSKAEFHSDFKSVEKGF